MKDFERRFTSFYGAGYPIPLLVKLIMGVIALFGASALGYGGYHIFNALIEALK